MLRLQQALGNHNNAKMKLVGHKTSGVLQFYTNSSESIIKNSKFRIKNAKHGGYVRIHVPVFALQNN